MNSVLFVVFAVAFLMSSFLFYSLGWRCCMKICEKVEEICLKKHVFGCILIEISRGEVYHPGYGLHPLDLGSWVIRLWIIRKTWLFGLSRLS